MALTGTLLADFSAFVKEAQGATRAVVGMEQSADDAAKKLSSFAGGFNIKQALTDPVGTATEGMHAFAGVLGPTATGVAAVTGTVVTLGAAMFGLATSAAETVAAFDDLHDKTGMSVPALSQLSNAAKVIGADMTTLTGVVFKLEQGMGENTDKFQAGLAAMGLSTNELKAAGPDKYLELVTAGLAGIADPSARAAAGVAVLGKGYKDVAAALNDLSTGMKLTADITPFSAQQAADAEAFQFQIASVKTHMSEMATEIGMTLIPAMSVLVDVAARTGLALVHIADLGGLISGTWRAMKLGLGEAALAQETFNAVAATTNKLFSEQGATATSVAEKMLAMGYSEQTVAEQTGLTTTKVRELNTALAGTKTAAEDYATLWAGINKKLAEGAPTIDGVSSSTRGLVADMNAAGISVAKMAAATGLSEGQIKKLIKTQDESAASTKAWQKANEEVAASQVPWQETLAQMDAGLVKDIQIALSMGATQEAVATAWGRTRAEVKAAAIGLEEYGTALTATADLEKDELNRRKEITAITLKQTNDRVLAEFTKKQAAEASEAAFVKAALADAQAQDAATLGVKATTAATVDGMKVRELAAKAAYEAIATDGTASMEKITAAQAAWHAASDATAAAVKASHVSTADTLGTAYQTHFKAAQGSFEQFQGVVVAGTAEMIAGLTSFHDSGAYVQMQKDMRDAQNARGGFYIDTGIAGTVPTQTRDSGGPVVAGTSYLIGGGKAPELFTPGASGFVTPGGGGGGTTVQNIYVTQPLGTPEAIARAISDAQVGFMKGQGVRLPYGT
jgi:hypothetical protein